MRKLLYTLFILAFISFAIASCHWSMDGVGKDDEVMIDVKINRFDKLMDEYISLNSFSALQKMNSDYPLETKLLIEDVLMLGATNDENINLRLREYYSDTILRKLSAEALSKFADMSKLEQGFTRGFQRMKKALPHVPVPAVYAQISALNQSVVVGDSILGFSIDKYMGADYPLYQCFYYDYQCKSMSPERILPDCFKFYLMSEFTFPWEWHRTLLDHIMHRGKIHWAVTRILEYDSFEKEMGYTEEEGRWCREHADSVWNYLISSGLLYSTDPRWQRAFLHPAEYTLSLGEDSPAEVGVWLGVHLIDEYMKKNPDVTLSKLMNDIDYREMLKKANIPY